MEATEEIQAEGDDHIAIELGPALDGIHSFLEAARSFAQAIQVFLVPLRRARLTLGRVEGDPSDGGINLHCRGNDDGE